MKKIVQKQKQFWHAVYPVSYALFPVTLLYYHNRYQVSPLEFLGVVGLSLGVVLLLIVFVRWRFRLSDGGNVSIALLLLFFYTYGHLYTFFGGLYDDFTRSFLIGALWMCLGIFVISFTCRSARSIIFMKSLTSSIGFFLLLLSFGHVLLVAKEGDFYHRSWMLVPPIKDQEMIYKKLDEPAILPDVYYLIFDRYPRADVLHDYYDFDNSPFLSKLEDMGFAISTNSFANYPKTDLAMTSTLNMEYLDSMAQGEDKNSTHPNTLWLAMHDNKVGAYLKKKGYLYINIPSWWKPMMNNWAADINYIYDEARSRNTLAGQLYEHSLAYPFISMIMGLTSTEMRLAPEYEVARSTHLDQIQKIKEIARRRGQKFVYAHILLPHNPYVFTRDGSRPQKYAKNEEERKEMFIDQLVYTNGLILDILTEITNNARVEPVIILQSDEGPYPPRYKDNEIMWIRWSSDLSKEELQRKFSIFLAVRAPGKQIDIHDIKTPVNLFRLLFNTYFEEDLPYLEERIFITPQWQLLYDYRDITEDILGE